VIFRTKFNRWATTGAVALLFTGLALVFAARAAHGTTGNNDPSIGQIKVVEPCTAAQAHANNGRGALGEHGDAFYRCRETKPGCWQWMFQYDGRPKSGHTWKPRPCPKCSPSPSVSSSPSKSPSVSASPSASKSASASPSPSKSTTSASVPAAGAPAPGTTPVANILPVTGTPTVIVGATAVGVLLFLAGLILLVVSLRSPRPRRNGS
jgi:hypothetical protein